MQVRLLLLALMTLIACNTLAGTVITTYYHSDGMGNLAAATDEAGNLLWKRNYAPYGAPKQASTDLEQHPSHYTGHVYDSDTKLHYMGQRYYDPAVGRFMGFDPEAAIDHIRSNPMLFNR